MPTKPSEELLAAPLPELIRDLGLAVAEANLALSKVPGGDIVYTIPEAEVELAIAMSLSKEHSGTVGAGGNIMGFTLNASYANTFGFSEQASSRIRLTVRATPRSAAVP